jgi:hypothetical protein
MADATDVLMVVVDRDVTGRVRDVQTYGPGVAPPSEVADYLPEEVRRRERQIDDPREEVKDKGAGWYQLPGGETVRGMDAVREAGYSEEDVMPDSSDDG